MEKKNKNYNHYKDLKGTCIFLFSISLFLDIAFFAIYMILGGNAVYYIIGCSNFQINILTISYCLKQYLNRKRNTDEFRKEVVEDLNEIEKDVKCRKNEKFGGDNIEVNSFGGEGGID